MTLETEIRLVDDLINQRTGRTVRDFIRIRGDMEKYSAPMQRIVQNVIDNEKTPAVTRAII